MPAAVAAEEFASRRPDRHLTPLYRIVNKCEVSIFGRSDRRIPIVFAEILKLFEEMSVPDGAALQISARSRRRTRFDLELFASHNVRLVGVGFLSNPLANGRQILGMSMWTR